MKNLSAVSVDVSELTVKFGDFVAVNNISFSVGTGEIFGFLGANGAGKTTTIRVLCGLLVPTSGRVQISDVSFEEGSEAMKSKVGYMSQKFTLYNDLTVDENFAFTASLRKLPRLTLNKRKDELLEFINFSKPTNTLVRDLPGGIKQQVSLAASILHDPEIVFLDEPTAGVTPAARARFWALIRKLSGNGKTIFVTTHYMDEAEQCGRIALMRAGEIIALDSPENLKRNTFPDSLFELDPRGVLPEDMLSRLHTHDAISSIDSYGMRYHLTIRDPKKWEDLREDLAGFFSIQEIQPSLEDVFIRLVEGASR
ncbi:MAG: ABC transporter ATP-binding protein [Deltaproteobacteria bacterium]|nr:ABC transporter ATP-binding protein [Deltaproteobacteria bacterium]